MPTPGIAVPGTTVPASSLVATGGAQGIQGTQGTQGIAGDAEVGSIKAWPSVTPPSTWMLMDGSAISRTLYPDLFTLIGTTFGTGDGSTTFNLPDARGRFILNLGQSNAAGNTLHSLADLGGEEKHALVASENAAHVHANSTVKYFQVASGSGSNAYSPGGTTGSFPNTDSSGSGLAHNTMPPFLCLVYIIKVSKGGGPTAQAPIADTTQAGLMNPLSGNASDYVGGDNACHARNSGPTSRYYDYDEFLGGPKFLTLGNSGGAGAQSGLIGNSGAGRPGLLQLAAGSVTGAWARGYTIAPFYLSNGSIVWRASLNPINAAAGATSQHLFGLSSNPGPIVNTASWYIIFYFIRSSSSNWSYQVRSTTNVISADTGVAASGAWTDLVIAATATTVKFWVNGTLVATVTTNIPPSTQSLFPYIAMASASDTANYTFYADSCEIEIETSIAGKFSRVPSGVSLAQYL